MKLPLPRLEQYYEITDDGRVFRIPCYRADGKYYGRKEMRKFINRGSGGYESFNLTVNGKQFSYRTHRALAEAFLPNPLGYPEVNHKDGDKMNNRLENLEWCSSEYNKRHALETGLKPSKLDVGRVREIRFLAGSMPRKLIAERYGVATATVRQIINRQRWKHI